MRLAADEALAAISAFDSKALIVSTCGYISRALYALADRPGNFYLMGSMGSAAGVALGIAHACRTRRVIAIDGDGSVAMGLSTLLMIADQRPRLVHVILDNGVYESTGGQRAILPVDIAAMARAAGYASACTVSAAADLTPALKGPMPAFVHVRVGRRAGPAPRIDLTPPQLAERFQAAVMGG